MPYLCQFKTSQHALGRISPESQISKVTRQALIQSDVADSNYVAIAGVPVRRGQAAVRPALPLAETAEVIDTMRDIAIGIGAALPIIVIGPIGSGKTHLINQIAILTRNQLISYQLSSETDAACLIGGYIQGTESKNTGQILGQNSNHLKSNVGVTFWSHILESNFGVKFSVTFHGQIPVSKFRTKGSNYRARFMGEISRFGGEILG